MTGAGVRVRKATPADAKVLQRIYAPYVEKTAVTFEYDPPDAAEFQRRMERTLRRYPYLAAERAGELVGYAYAGAFAGRAAYDWAAEVSIYLREDCRGQGTGKRLYGALEGALRAQNILALYACIAVSEDEDEYLTNNSREFHAHMGYRLAGTFRQCGYKFGRWYDMVWMEKIIAPHAVPPPPVRAFGSLSTAELEKAGIEEG